MEVEMEFESASAENLPNELWVEIFKNVEDRTLLELTLVCKHWNRLIFKYLGQRFQLNLDAGAEQIPKDGIPWAPERTYRRVHLTYFNVDVSPKHMKVFKELAPNIESLKLSQEMLDLSDLMMMLNLCPRLNELSIKGVQMVVDDFNLMQLLKVAAQIINADTSLDLDYNLGVFNKTYEPCDLDIDVPDEWSKPTFPALKSLAVNIADLESFESAFLPCVPNVTELELVLDQPNLGVIEKMASRLKVLRVKVLEDAVANFFALRLPALEVLILTLNASFRNDDLKQFLLGCTTLKTVAITVKTKTDQDLFPEIAEGLPVVERLQISGETTTALKGLEKMRHLKELALKGCYVSRCFYHMSMESDPTVRKLECIGVMFHDMVYDILVRMMNVNRLTLSVRDVHDMTDFTNGTGCLEEFTLLIDRIYPYIFKQLLELQCLSKLVIRAVVFAKKHFPLLQKVIVMSELKTLSVTVGEKGEGKIPLDMARQVASANRSCMFLLNGERVEPVESISPAAGGEESAGPSNVDGESTVAAAV